MSRTALWALTAFALCPLVRIVLHLIEYGAGLYGSASPNTLVFHYLFAVAVNALPALGLVWGETRRNLVVYAGEIVGIFLAVMTFRLLGSLGSGNIASTFRSSLLDLLNYTVLALVVCAGLFFAFQLRSSAPQS